MVDVDNHKTCGRCGHTWCSHTDSPVRCPRCGTYRWQGEPKVNTCAVCGHTWFSRTGGTPLRCPSCKTRSWIGCPRRDGPLGRNVADGLSSDVIVDRYLNGDGCLRIAIDTGIPLSTVIDTVRERVCGSRGPRM